MAALLSPYLGGAILTDAQLAPWARYLDLLLRWNARMNLTAVRDADSIVTRHFGESLFAARRLYPVGSMATGDCRLLDIGSGAGFPGVPIKIWAPALRLTLLESNQRKSTFLREVVRALQLTDVEVLTTRAEDFMEQITNHKSQIANLTITFRAVERFEQILPTALNLLQNSGARRRRLALLIGVAQVQTARDLANALTWSSPLPMPESSNRVLLVGSC